MDYKHVLSIIDNESEQFDSVITKTEKAMLSAAVNAIKKLDVDASGNIRTTTANIKLLATIRTKLATVASNKEFMSGVKSVANAMDQLYKAQVDFYSKAFPQKTLGENAKKKHQALQQIAISNVASGLSQSALTASVVEPLNKMLLRAVTSGAKYADLIDEFHKQLESSDDSTSALAKYAKTYATTAMTQLAGENNRLFTDDLGAEWFQYVGSVIETSRQFCELLTEKEYIHKSEIKDILNGYIEIDGKVHECEMNPKTGLPKGLIEGTTEQNFQVNVGGWNCRHQLIPISELMVPEHIRAKFDKGVNDNGIPIGLNAQIEQARELAKKWGLSVQLRVLDKRVETKDIPGIQSTITTINNKSNDLQEQYNNAIKNCKEWGISTSPLDTVMRNPTSADILNAINGLNDRCTQEQREYNNYLIEAKNAIKDAKTKSVDCIEVVDDVYTITEDKTAWIGGKVSFMQRLKDLLSKINIFRSTLADDMNKLNITYNAVQELTKPLTTDEIIQKVGGGDLTKGSCSSVALAYAGNKCGLDVLDFRDGESRNQFSKRTIIKEIAKITNGQIVKNGSDFESAKQLLSHVDDGKEYYFTCGSHASIIRKTNEGVEYLELQSPTENGYKSLTNDVLKRRFGAKSSHTVMGQKYEKEDFLIDIDRLKNNAEIRKILGYINTQSNAQNKGNAGTVK